MDNTLSGGMLNRVTVPPCLATLIRSTTSSKQQMKQPTIKQTFHKYPQKKLLIMQCTLQPTKIREALCKTSRVTTMEEMKLIH